LIALRACGRFKVTVATLSDTSTFKHSYLAYRLILISKLRCAIDRPSAVQVIDVGATRLNV
jgi:hypothetical protein